jgi:glutathione S-transferase
MNNYILYYWPIPFRGNLIRCLLEYNDVPYEEGSVSDLVQMKEAALTPESSALFMAPPLLFDRELNLYLSQAPAIVSHLSRKLSFCPTDLRKLALADKIVNDCNDALNEVTANCGYSGMWDQASWNEFISGEFIRWIQIVEFTAIQEGLGVDSGFALGTPNATFADTTIFAVWATMERSLPELSPIMRSSAPRIMALCDRLSVNKGLASLFSRQSPSLYCGGQIEKSIRAVINGMSKEAK